MSSLIPEFDIYERECRSKFSTKTRKTRLNSASSLSKSKFRNKPSTRYITNSSQYTKEDEERLYKEKSPFKTVKPLEIISFYLMSRENVRRNIEKEKKLKYNQRFSYRSRQTLGMRRRLYVEDVPIRSERTMLDVDPQFFTSVENRPTMKLFKVGQYIQDLRDIVRIKICTGYRADEIELINEKFRLEQEEHNKIEDQYFKCVDTFETFIFEKHNEATNLLEYSQQLGRLSAQKYDEFKTLSKQFASLRTIMYTLEEKWRSCKLYQQFLFIVSPLGWKMKHYPELTESASSSVFDETESLQKFVLPSVGKVLSLDDLIDQFMVDVSCQARPLLYFTEPNELFTVFQFIATQNLNSLTYLEALGDPMEDVKKKIKFAREQYAEEENHFLEIIALLERGIREEEEQEQYIERTVLEFLDVHFRDIIADPGVIKLNLFLEDAHECHIGPNDAGMSIMEMFDHIENYYEEMLLELDYLPQRTVYTIEHQCYSESIHALRTAELASKILTNIDRLTASMARTLAPITMTKKRELKRRSHPVDKVIVKKEVTRDLTEKEMTYLQYMIDFCKFTDNEAEALKTMEP